ncbi:MAG: ABC transporter permease, partial [Gemmatimonadaceae bacterium]
MASLPASPHPGAHRTDGLSTDTAPSRSLGAIRRDLFFAWKTLSRRRGFAALVVLTLALGIGVTTALFAIEKSVLLTPLPYSRPEGVAMVWSAWKGFDQTWLSYDEYEAWQALPVFSGVALYSDGSITLTDGDESERLRFAQVDAQVFPVLGVAPFIGRGPTAEEDRPNGPRVIVLGYELWQRRFGGDPSVLGRTIQVNGEGATVIGVMPSGFRLPLDYGSNGRTEAWMPLATDAASEGALPGPEIMPGGSSHNFYGVARLAPGATIESANRALASTAAALKGQGLLTNTAQFRAYVVSVDDQVTGRIRPVLFVVLAAVGFVLLIAIANVAGLLLVRGESRRRELAIRVALGADRRRLARLLLTESALLSVLGALAGVGVAVLGLWAVRRTAPAGLPRIADAQLDPSLLLVAFGIAVVVAALIGVLPVLQATRADTASQLKEGGRGQSSGAERLRWRQGLVSAEVALAVVLVVGAGLMIRSVSNLFAVNPGFDSRGVLTMRLSTPSLWYQDSSRVVQFWDELQREVGALPRVQSAGAVRLLPLVSEMGDWGLRVEGYTPPPNEGTPGDWQVVTPGYFEAMGLRVQTGRALDQRDGMDGPLAMVINQGFADKYFAGRTAVGGQVRIGSDPMRLPYTVVGVVDDVRHNALTREVKPQFYATIAHFARSPGNTMRTMHLVVRSSGDPALLVNPVRAIIGKIDPRIPISDVRSMEEVLGASIAEPRFAMQLLGLFGALALVLSAIGIFGVVSQVVALRRHEFGIRAALGATPRSLVALSLRTGLRQAALGIAFGVAAALGLTRLMTQLLHGV